MYEDKGEVGIKTTSRWRKKTSQEQKKIGLVSRRPSRLSRERKWSFHSAACSATLNDTTESYILDFLRRCRRLLVVPPWRLHGRGALATSFCWRNSFLRHVVWENGMKLLSFAGGVLASIFDHSIIWASRICLGTGYGSGLGAVQLQWKFQYRHNSWYVLFWVRANSGQNNIVHASVLITVQPDCRNSVAVKLDPWEVRKRQSCQVKCHTGVLEGLNSIG